MGKGGLVRSLLRIFATAATVVTSLVLIVGVAIYVFATTGIGTDRLGDEAEAAIRNLSGLEVEASFGPAHVSIDRSQLLAISIPNVRLDAKTGGAPLLEAGSIDFGVRAIPLLSGDVQLGSARISDARVFSAALGTGESSDWTVAIKNTDGLVDPDLVAPVVFDAVNRVYAAFAAGTTHTIELDNVEFVVPRGSAVETLRINDATLTRDGDDELSFAANLLVDDRAVAIEASATRDADSKTIAALKLDIGIDGPADLPDEADSGGDASGNAPKVADTLGSVDLTLSGVEGKDGAPSKLSFTASLGRSILLVNSQDYLDGEVDAAGSITTGENKVRLEKLAIRQGRSNFEFYGPLGPRPVTADQPPAYRFELASDKSTSAPANSEEPAVDLKMMLTGSFDPAARRLDLPSIEVRTSSGGLKAKATIDMVPGKAPGVALAVDVPELSTSHFKQLWPFTAASNARLWALSNLFGGRLSHGHVEYKVEPGRIGNGVPLTGDEVFGQMDIAGARFDITGSIPPMRDTIGTVAFRGNDVDVKLASGAVYLPDGRAVSASNGAFTIRDAYKDIVIGQLELDIAGEASSIAELASYDPIDGLRRTGMTAGDFSGDMSGHVSAQIPLVGDVDPATLNWGASLDYSDLALAEPIEDQLVTEAKGNITLDPQKAVIKAEAKLNGAPAEIAVTEPLRAGAVKPSRDISIDLDDEARNEIAPGITDLVSGPTKVSFTSGDGDAREIKVDLAAARLDLPWIGWSKGPGIAASAQFTLTTKDGVTRLGDFELNGKSFTIAGDITLSDGGLARARFGTVRLNRGDDASASIVREGKGYNIDIAGKALDARAIIKLLKAEKTSDDEATGKRSITVAAKVDRLLGFHDEVLSGVKLNYRSAGSGSGTAEFAGTTSAGGAVALQDRTADGNRALEMQSNDAGALLRFLDIYEHMSGGKMKFALAGPADGILKGQVDTAAFEVVDEPKLRSLVSSAPAGDGRSLNDAVKTEIDTSRVTFERMYASIAKGEGSFAIQNGVLRGPTIGSTFQGTLYDKAGNMDMTGTFMPAYGLNRIFGELPLVGVILGNGRDRGLIGVTFKLTGNADEPTLTINPLSVIAPGIFRSIFEFR